MAPEEGLGVAKASITLVILHALQMKARKMFHYLPPVSTCFHLFSDDLVHSLVHIPNHLFSDRIRISYINYVFPNWRRGSESGGSRPFLRTKYTQIRQ